MEPSDGFTLDEVVHIYERWFDRAPRGFAMLVYQGEPARRRFLKRLEEKIESPRFVDLSRERDVQAVIESMRAALEARDSAVFFGLDEALPATPENARLINYNRERLASFGARQLWVLNLTWKRALLTWAYDLYSWFLPNITFGAETHDEGPMDDNQSESPWNHALSPLALRSATLLLDRFERAFRKTGKVEWKLIVGALAALYSAGPLPESDGLLERALDLIHEGRSSGLTDSPQAWRDFALSLEWGGDVQRLLGRTNDALASYEESLAIRRKLSELHGESPTIS